LRGESLPEVWGVLRSSSIGLFLLSATLATIAFPMRAARWRYILEPVAGTIEFRALWRATAIGMMVNNVALARAGEPVRAFVLARSTRRVTFSAAIASLVVDRVFDSVIVLLLLLFVVSLPGFPSGASIMGVPIDRVLLSGAGIALAAVVALTVIATYPHRLARVWEMTVGRIAPRFMERGRGIVLSFGAGLGVLRDPRRSAIVFVWALAQWLVNGASFWVGLLAVGLDAPFTAGLFLQSLLAAAVAVPSAPGFFGVFEAATKVALSVYGVDDTLAVSYALGYHILTFIPITLIGFWYLARLGLHYRDLSAARQASDQAGAADGTSAA
jgi:uncharacterized protein (TIRG00374 family)